LPRIKEARVLSAKAQSASADGTDLQNQLDDIASSVAAGAKQADLIAAISKAATAAAGGSVSFESGAEVEAFLRGREQAK
jgi:hypothetical protein